MGTDDGLRVVLVEDDPAIAGMVRAAMSPYAESFDHAPDACRGLILVETVKPDVAIVDLGLPDRDGLGLISDLRRFDVNLGVICLTARSAEADRIGGFDVGADDYVVKPFSPRELVSRVQALGRRVKAIRPPRTGESEVAGIVIDHVRHEVTTPDGGVDLTPMEHGLLVQFVRNRGVALSRLDLLQAVWGHEWLGDSRTVDVHVGQLRRKLSPPIEIATVRGVGYRLE